MAIDRATERGTLGEFAAKTDPMTTHFAVPNLLPESLPNFVPTPPNHAKLPQPVPAQAIENIQPDFFRYVFKTAGFNRSPASPFLILTYSVS